jgi:uracil-DNA glycosylase
MMTREDVLRELELLPVWQLRAPLLQTEKVPAKLAEKITPKITEAAPELPTPEAPPTNQQAFDMHISDDKCWLFICPASRMAIGLDAGDSQSILFNNILSALHIKKVQNHAHDLAQVAVKVIIVMGEKTAQTLLNSTETIDNLRGKAHRWQDTPLIVTYSCAEMLEHLPNKAKTWHDLNTALTIIGQP